MQRYRVNYRLFFGLAAGSFVVASGAFFFAHPWQVNRKANWFRERAEEALSSDDLRKAYDYQYKYVRYRSQDDTARIKLANIAVDVSKLEGATQEDHMVAYQILDESVRRTRDPALRKKLADVLMAIGRPQDALVHIEELLEDDPNNTEILSLRVRALFLTKNFRGASDLALGLVGYDKKNKTFDVKKAAAADQPEIYALLADALYNKKSTRALASRVIDQMIETNPESYDAYLKQSSFLQKTGGNEEALVALEKAYELNPTNIDVLRRKGGVAFVDKNYDEAKRYFEKTIELYPDKILFYQLLAQTEARQGNLEEAIATLDRGIERFGKRKSLYLHILKINFLFGTNDLSAVKKEIDVLVKLHYPELDPLIAYQRARIKWYEKKWPEAARELKRVRPLLFKFPDEQAIAGVLLGRTYERLGKLDLALRTYTLVLQNRPEYSAAIKGQARVRRRIRPDEAGESFGLIGKVKKMLTLPEDQQDWEQIDQQITNFAEEQQISEVGVAIQRAEVFLERKMFSDAKRLIQSAAKLEPDNMGVRFSAVRLLNLDPESGPGKAIALLDKIVKQFGETPQSRILRIDLLLALGGEDVAQKLHTLVEGTEQWSAVEQASIYSKIGIGFQQLGMPKESIQYWRKAADLRPNSLPIRMHLFELALQQRDDDAISDAQQKVLELAGSKQDASYLLTEVKRRVVGFRLEKIAREEVLEARNMLDDALQQRPEWSELHVLYGQLLVVLNEEIDVALRHLDEALKYGPANLNAVGLQVQLLAKRGLYQDARDKMDRLPKAVRGKMLGGVEAEVLLATGDPESGYEVAEKIAEEQPEVAKTQQWFAKVAQQAGRLDAAATALHKATKLVPGNIENWFQLLALYTSQKKARALEDISREAQLALDAEFLPLLTAKSYELNGLWRPAEEIYLAMYAGRLDEVALARRMASFYLLWAKSDASNLQRAGKYINHILRAANEEKIPTDHVQALWARNQAARLLANSRQYQSALKALRLLEQNAVEGKLSVADQMLQAQILASLRDPASQGKAIRLFTELYKNNRLEKKYILVLAQLLRNANRWQQCEELMLNALGTYGADTQVWSTYIKMLIDRGDYSKAQSRINRLKQLDSKSISYIRLLAQLASKQGKQSLVRKTLAALLPKKLNGTLNTEQLQTVRGVAQLAVQCEDFEMAEKLYQLYVQRLPKAEAELVQFQSLYGDAEAAIATMEKEFPRHMNAVLTMLNQMLRKRRTEFGDRYDEKINRMIATAIRDDPDSATRLLFYAELLEIEQKYQQSVKAYDDLLSRDDAPLRVRAAAMNNLAFLLAVLGERLEEAEKLVNQSMETLGPIADLLDTRALVRTASKKYDLAIEDLTLAISVGRDPIKLYHLARVQLLAGNEKAALKSWKEAKNLGIEKGELPLPEQSDYVEFEAKIRSFEKT